MNLAPLQAYRTPDYPTQKILRDHPELLRAVPSRWKHNRVVLGSLAGMLALMEQSAARAEDQPASLHVAPIFEHGKGKGSYGCVVVNPPVFLTEAEAREIIESEAKKAGLEFTERDHRIDKVPVPYVEKYVAWEDPRPDAPPTSGTTADGKRWFRWGGDPAERFQKKGPEQTREVTQEEEVTLTAWDSQKKVGYRFVAHEDFEAGERRRTVDYEKQPDGTLNPLRGFGKYVRSTARRFDVIGTAQRVQRGLVQVKEPGTVAVFYDPLCSPVKPPQFPSWEPFKNDNEPSPEELEARKKAIQDYENAYHASGKPVSAEELRAQVRDFLAWLKAQGVM